MVAIPRMGTTLMAHVISCPQLLASFSAPQSLPENDVMRIDVSSHGTPKAQFGKVACLQSFLGGSFRALLGQVSEDVNVNT